MEEMQKLFIILLTSWIFYACSFEQNSKDSLFKTDTLNYNLHVFYYNWYGNPEFDGEYRHWAHDVLKKNSEDTTTGHFPGGENIGANYFPLLGTYSCNDSSVIKKHMEMISRAGVGVVILTWWGKGSFEDNNVRLIMEIAQQFDIKIGFHIEPFPERNPQTVKEAIQYIVSNYGNHSAFLRMKDQGNKPLFYVYDSYLTTAEDWATILTDNGKNTIRGTNDDAVMIGLWVNEKEEEFFTKSGFDGFYTYFASSGFTYGSTPANWSKMQKWAKSNNKLFIPCVGPGYIDTRIRPWNAQNTKDREGGEYYDRMFDSAINSGSSIIGITSFNEWHEGTQIEPSIKKEIPGFNYQNFLPKEEWYYIDRTKYWSDRFR